MNSLTKAVARAITEAPVSMREIARRAGVSQVQLTRIVEGSRNATPSVARLVRDALRSVSKDSASGAARVERALARVLGEKRGG